MPEQFITHNRWGILQYCPVQLVSAVLIFAMDLAGIYKEGSLSPKAGYPYMAIIISISQSWAIYCLVNFYLGLKHIPKDTVGGERFTKGRLGGKFMCIKGVVFFTFWQGLLLSGLVDMGLIE